MDNAKRNFINIPILFQHVENLNNLPNFLFKLPNETDTVSLQKTFFTNNNNTAETVTSSRLSEMGTNTIFCMNKPVPFLLVISSVNGIRCDFATILLVQNEIIQEHQRFAATKAVNNRKEILGTFSNKAFINIPLAVGDGEGALNIKVENNVKNTITIITTTELLNQIFNEFAINWRYQLIEGRNKDEFWLLDVRSDTVVVENISRGSHAINNQTEVENVSSGSPSTLELQKENPPVPPLNYTANNQIRSALAYNKETSAFVPVATQRQRQQLRIPKPQFHQIIVNEEDHRNNWSASRQLLKSRMHRSNLDSIYENNNSHSMAHDDRTLVLPVSESMRTLSSIVDTAVAKNANINIQFIGSNPPIGAHLFQQFQRNTANNMPPHVFQNHHSPNLSDYLASVEKSQFNEHLLQSSSTTKTAPAVNDRNHSSRVKAKALPTILLKKSANKLKTLLLQQSKKTHSPYFRPFPAEHSSRRPEGNTTNVKHVNILPRSSVSVLQRNEVAVSVPRLQYPYASVVRVNEITPAAQTMTPIQLNGLQMAENSKRFISAETNRSVFYQHKQHPRDI